MKTTHSNSELYLNGIYRIYSKTTNKSYIGMASAYKNKNKNRRGFYVRYHTHLNKLLKNIHHNKYLQNSFNKYGKEDFIFEILEICKPEECSNLEIKYMDLYKSMITENGYNIIKQPLSRFGKKTSFEIREKLSNLYKNVKRPLEIIKKWSNSVSQYDLNGTFIASYYSMSEASRVTGIQRQDIGQSIIGRKCKTAGGFIWKKDKDIV